MRKEKAGQERVENPGIEGLMKGARGMPLMWDVVSIMRTETEVSEVGILRSGGGWAIVVDCLIEDI